MDATVDICKYGQRIENVSKKTIAIGNGSNQPIRRARKRVQWLIRFCFCFCGSPVDNRSKRKREKGKLLQDFSSFAQQRREQTSVITPQLALATYQFLSTSIEVGPNHHLPCFTEILLGFTGLYWALLGFTGFYWPWSPTSS